MFFTLITIIGILSIVMGIFGMMWGSEPKIGGFMSACGVIICGLVVMMTNTFGV